jgi:tetratricopeptide (TPR) repeat protein
LFIDILYQERSANSRSAAAESGPGPIDTPFQRNRLECGGWYGYDLKKAPGGGSSPLGLQENGIGRAAAGSGPGKDIRIMADFQVERLKAQPQQVDDVWFGGLIRLPAWEPGAAGVPRRLWLLIVLSSGTGTLHHSDPMVAEKITPAAALDVLATMATTRNLAGHRPGTLLLNDAALVESLEERLVDAGIEIRHEPLPPPVQEVLATFGQVTQTDEPPGALTGKGVTVEKMRSLAEAAKDFAEAAPWRYLSDSDLVHVESPKPPKGFEYFVAMGSGDKVRGLSFFSSPRHYDDMVDRGPNAVYSRGAWVLYLDPIDGLPIADADLWEDHNLPVADARSYPFPHKIGPGNQLKRPDAKQLAFLEGLLRAIAGTSEREMDAGRWSKTVETSAGQREFTLALLDLLEPLIVPTTLHERETLEWPELREQVMDEVDRLHSERPELAVDAAGQLALRSVAGQFEESIAEFGEDEPEPDRPLTPGEQAAYLANEAMNLTTFRSKALLARRALQLDPDCTSAYVSLAECAAELEQARDLYARGVAAAERRIDPKFIREHGGHFRDHPELEDYVIAKGGLARCLADLEHYDEAIELWFELVQLDPDDGEGIRRLLLPRLLQLGRDERAEELWRQYEDEPDPVWQYAGALAAYRREGSNPEARQRLTQALARDPELADGLLRTGQEQAQPPEEGDKYIDAPADGSFGPDEVDDEEEESRYLLKTAWQDTPGAAEWLRSLLPARSGKKRGKSTRKRNRP